MIRGHQKQNHSVSKDSRRNKPLARQLRDGDQAHGVNMLESIITFVFHRCRQDNCGGLVDLVCVRVV